VTRAGGQRSTGRSTVAVLGISAAAGLVPLNSTMIAVALPEIADDFEISTGSAGILIIGYLVVMLIGQPLAGRLGDSVGNRRMVNIALVGLTVFSAVAAVAWVFAALVVARIAQAVFAAALVPSVQSLLRATTPPEHQGRTFGLLGSVLGVGAASGPLIGGLLTQAFDWPAIFLVNIPIAVAALVISLRVHTPIHEEADEHGDSEAVAASGRIANPVFGVAFSLQSLSTSAQYALLLLTPIVLHARGWQAGPIGIVLSALTIGMILMSPMGGRLGDRHGRRAPTRVGLAVATGAVAVLLIGGPTITVLVLVAGLGLFGVGLGVATPSLMTAALESVPMHRTGAAAGVFAMSRYVGSITTSVAVSVLVTADGHGSRAVLAISLVAMVASVFGAAWLPARPQRVGID